MVGRGRAGNGMNRSINRWRSINLGSGFGQDELRSLELSSTWEAEIREPYTVE